MSDMQYGGMNVYGLYSTYRTYIVRSQLVFCCFHFLFTLTTEYEAVTADGGYKVHSPFSMKREQKQWEMGWMCEGSMWAGTRAHVCV